MAQPKVFHCDPRNFEVTEEMIESFNTRGYVFVRGFLDKEELEQLRKTVEDTDLFVKPFFALLDDTGGKTERCIWRHPGNDVTGIIARSEKVAGTAEQLLGGEVYHYHSKLMTKAPRVGGRHLWHQDYGYWYQNGCLFPDMLSVLIPIDPCGKINGCLEVLEGSHLMGRLDHSLRSGLQGCDPERIEQVKTRCPHMYVEMDPGDAIFFHCNLLHCSGNNLSDTKRWVLISAYNKASNDPVKKHHHPNYTKLEKVPNSAIRECRNYTDLSGKEFTDPRTSGDTTININFGKSSAL
ncbi:uncharacterized protein LOC112575239 [Pomacea canaliculata]|nr:uncharacterized protein LOC112575239 [Pomacea canaliculata]